MNKTRCLVGYIMPAYTDGTYTLFESADGCSVWEPEGGVWTDWSAFDEGELEAKWRFHRVELKTPKHEIVESLHESEVGQVGSMSDFNLEHIKTFIKPIEHGTLYTYVCDLDPVILTQSRDPYVHARLANHFIEGGEGIEVPENTLLVDNQYEP